MRGRNKTNKAAQCIKGNIDAHIPQGLKLGQPSNDKSGSLPSKEQKTAITANGTSKRILARLHVIAVQAPKNYQLKTSCIILFLL